MFGLLLWTWTSRIIEIQIHDLTLVADNDEDLTLVAAEETDLTLVGSDESDLDLET